MFPAAPCERTIDLASASEIAGRDVKLEACAAAGDCMWHACPMQGENFIVAPTTWSFQASAGRAGGGIPTGSQLQSRCHRRIHLSAGGAHARVSQFVVRHFLTGIVAN